MATLLGTIIDLFINYFGDLFFYEQNKPSPHPPAPLNYFPLPSPFPSTSPGTSLYFELVFSCLANSI